MLYRASSWLDLWKWLWHEIKQIENWWKIAMLWLSNPWSKNQKINRWTDTTWAWMKKIKSKTSYLKDKFNSII